MSTVPSITTRSISARRPWPLAARWLLTGLAFPPAGLLASTVAGPVDAPPAALVGGAIAGAGIGAAQRLALRDHAVGWSWAGVTAGGMAVGLAVGAAAVGYRTGTADLVTMGLVTGAVLGPAQAALLRTTSLTSKRGTVTWAVVVPLLLALGWFTTASAGVDVEQQYAVFGLTGALVSSGLGGLVLSRLVRRHPPQV